ncbi:MAG: type II toxin-antitoxin system ParD family antitoxin [Holosporales bacterium]|jgi:antitoxin ParD1/3/4
MHISLTPQMEQNIKDALSAGLYHDADEFLREALREKLLRDEQRQMHLQYVRNAVAQGIVDADAGRFVDGKTFMQELKKPYLA